MRLGSIKGEGQQLVTVSGCVDGDKAKLFDKLLVGEPCLLLLRAQHADAGFSLLAGVVDAVFHQRPAIALALIVAQHPQAVDVQKVAARNRDPRGLQRGVLDKDGRLGVQLAKDVPFPQALGKPLPLCLHAGMRLFAADDAAQVLSGQIFGRKIDKLLVHTLLLLLCMWLNPRELRLVQLLVDAVAAG